MDFPRGYFMMKRDMVQLTLVPQIQDVPVFVRILPVIPSKKQATVAFVIRKSIPNPGSVVPAIYAAALYQNPREYKTFPDLQSLINHMCVLHRIKGVHS